MSVALLSLLAIAAPSCPSHAVGASVFTDSTGYKGDNLYTAGPSYAELGMGQNLGGLAYGQKLVISYHGREVTARKLDIGLGGGDVFGKRRDIDLHTTATRPLRFAYGTGVVRVRKANC